MEYGHKVMIKKNNIEKAWLRFQRAIKPLRKRLILEIVLLVIVFTTSVVSKSMVTSLEDQNAGKRWGTDQKYGQLSVYFTDSAAITPDNIREFEYKIDQKIVENALANDSDEDSSTEGDSSSGDNSESEDENATPNTHGEGKEPSNGPSDFPGSNSGMNAGEGGNESAAFSEEGLNNTLGENRKKENDLDEENAGLDNSDVSDSGASNEDKTNKKEKTSKEQDTDERNYIDCYSAPGEITINKGDKSLTVQAVGVGGDFFFFHPMKLISGAYFTKDALMKDQIVVDEDLAWSLYGSNDVVGQVINIGEVPHIICGVVAKKHNKIYDAAGLKNSMVFLSYQSLALYGTINTSAGRDNSDNNQNGGSSSSSNTNGSSSNSINTSAINTVSGSSTETAHSNKPSPFDAQKEILLAESEVDSASTLTNDLDNSSTQDSQGGSTSTDSADNPSTSNPYKGGDSSSSSNESDNSLDNSGDNSDSSNANNTNSDSSDGSMSDGGNSSFSTGSDDTSTDSSNSVSTKLISIQLGDADSTDIPSTDVSNVPGISTYEIVMPNAVTNFAYNLVKEQIGLDDNQMTIIDNGERFNAKSLLKLIKAFPTRSMQLTNYCYPYWENIARGYEDIIMILFLCKVVSIVIFSLILGWLVVDTYRYKKWTVSMVIAAISDYLYEKKAAKIYSHKDKKISEGK